MTAWIKKEKKAARPGVVVVSSRPCRFPRPGHPREGNETKRNPARTMTPGRAHWTVPCWVLEIADVPPGGERAGRRLDVPCVA